MSKATQRGFTLIELVVVIVILGILAAFAVPRFINLQGEAREASVNALAGSVRSATALSHAVWLANGNVSPVAMEGQNIVMNAAGYPNADQIHLTLASLSGFDAPSVAGSVATISIAGHAGACEVTYDASVTPPDIDTDISGCN